MRMFAGIDKELICVLGLPVDMEYDGYPCSGCLSEIEIEQRTNAVHGGLDCALEVGSAAAGGEEGRV